MTTRVSDAGSNLIIEGELTLPYVSHVLHELDLRMKEVHRTGLTIDLSGVTRIDTSGIILLETIRDHGNALRIDVEFLKMPETVQHAIQSFTKAVPAPPPAGTRPEITLFERIGNYFFEIGHHMHDFFFLVADTFYYAVGNIFSQHGKRKGEFTNQLVLIGMNALPIVALVSFLVGLILALQSAAQLRQFGAAIYVADLIAISMAREMGPLMTAIMLAGRSGSAITSEIATMVVTEETDALKSMALNPVQYVLIPKFYAMTVAMPILTMLSVIIGIFGALVIALTYLDVGIEPFYNQVINALILKDIVTGLIKSLVFAWIIVILGAYQGFKVRGGAAEVGKATTASVVSSIFMVILADSLLGLVFYLGQGIDI